LNILLILAPTYDWGFFRKDVMETRNYETIFIVNPNAPEARVSEINSRNQQIIESSKGAVLQLDDWGKKKMAYQIEKEPKGHYFCLTYKADTKCVAEIERNLRINENIFRFLSVKIDETVDPLQAIEAYKRKLEAHAKREKERAERDAERNADRGDRGDRGGGRDFRPRPPRDDHRAPVTEAVVEPDIVIEEEE
jgi:small subunit ribosomal protein S6